MDLDSEGWPELPHVGSQVRFSGGGIVLQCVGVCTVVRADHVTNAAGKPGGQVFLQPANGKIFRVTLSQLRDHAELIEDGLDLLELQAQARWAAKHG